MSTITPSLKLLKGVAHNFGQDYLGKHQDTSVDWISDIISKAAIDSGIDRVRIDVLSGDIQPPTIGNPGLSQHLKELTNRLYHHLNSQGFSKETVRDVEIELIFIPEFPADCEKPNNWRPFYHCHITIVDFHGKCWLAYSYKNL